MKQLLFCSVYAIVAVVAVTANPSSAALGVHLRPDPSSAFIGVHLRFADRAWQTGKWTEVRVTRPRVTIGLSGRPFGGAPQDARVTELRTYAIETDVLRIELREPSPPPRRPVEALVGEPVTFAIEKKTVYVRDEDGTEHRLDVTKQTKKAKD